MNKSLILIGSIIFSISVLFTDAQIIQKPTQKIINVQDQAWFSVNSIARLSDKWGFVAEEHERRNNFLEDVSFHFIRLYANYFIKDNITVGGGYAHTWTAPTTPGWTSFTNDNRLFEQAQVITPVSKRITMVNRMRDEERWVQVIENDTATGANTFTDRIDYLLSFNAQIFKSENYPSLFVSNELYLQFGKAVMYNTFDQNWLFLGIKQKVTRNLKFDLGYFLVYQELSSGYQYNLNKTLRLWIYYTPDFRKKHSVK